MYKINTRLWRIDTLKYVMFILIIHSMAIFYIYIGLFHYFLFISMWLLETIKCHVWLALWFDWTALACWKSMGIVTWEGGCRFQSWLCNLHTARSWTSTWALWAVSLIRGYVCSCFRGIVRNAGNIFKHPNVFRTWQLMLPWEKI